MDIPVPRQVSQGGPLGPSSMRCGADKKARCYHMRHEQSDASAAGRLCRGAARRACPVADGSVLNVSSRSTRHVGGPAGEHSLLAASSTTACAAATRRPVPSRSATREPLSTRRRARALRGGRSRARPWHARRRLPRRCSQSAARHDMPRALVVVRRRLRDPLMGRRAAACSVMSRVSTARRPCAARTPCSARCVSPRQRAGATSPGAKTKVDETP